MITIVCIMGKSGAGKTEVEKQLEKRGYTRSISYTTRKMSNNEVNNVDYHFVSKKEFIGLVKKDIIMEYSMYAGDLYGSPHPIGVQKLVLVVEPHGYEKIKSIYGKQAIGVYIDVPDKIVSERVENRDRDTNESINKRIKEDKILFDDIENKVDIVVDGTKSINEITDIIVEKIVSLRKEGNQDEDM